MESLLEEFSIRHLRNGDSILLLIQPRRFTQSHTTAQDGCPLKAGQGGPVGGLAIRHITQLMKKVKLELWQLEPWIRAPGSKRGHGGRQCLKSV